MSILKVKNPTTGEWEEIAAIVGPTGPAGPQGIQGEKGDTGPAGADGADGVDGYTPQYGIDYWTSADIEEIKSYVDEALLKGAW